MISKKQEEYLAVAKRLKTRKYATIAKNVNRTRQAVHAALSKPEAKKKLLSTQNGVEEAQDTAFVAAVKALKLSTQLYSVQELAWRAGFPKYPRARQALQEAGIPFRTRTGGVSLLVRFAVKLPNTHKLTARQIADLSGFRGYNWPQGVLRRYGIPFLEVRRGGAQRSSPLADFAKTLPNSASLTARQIADLGGFEHYKRPSVILKQCGIPFLQVKPGGARLDS